MTMNYENLSNYRILGPVRTVYGKHLQSSINYYLFLVSDVVPEFSHEQFAVAPVL